jgi:tripartite-type tricarboxylate transporter receptor subunit TctC
MRLRHFLVTTVAASSTLTAIEQALSQEYPAKTIRIVTATPGGANDFMARLIAQESAPSLGQQVVVDNRPGSLIGELVAKAPPDGYTILIAGPTFTLSPLLQKESYDPIRDFAPITLAGTTPNLVAVHPALPVRTIRDLVALAKARPGELNYASTGTGGAAHLFTELLKSMAGINMVRINYKGAGQAVTALVSGEVQLSIATSGSVTQHIKSGRLRVLAVTSAKPSTMFPGLPTVAASGLPGYEAIQMQSVCAPAKTPAAIVRRLNQEIVRVLNREDSKQKLWNFGVEVAATTPEELAAAIKSDMATWDKVIKSAGIRVE